jgi:hypothetical protein
MITCFIFSKDRAFQLDALLRSIKTNCDIFNNIVVLYDASTDEFEDGYKKLLNSDHVFTNDLYLYSQNQFEQDTKQILNNKFFLDPPIHNYVCLMTDDSLFFRSDKFDEHSVKSVFDRHNPACVSMRLGLNILQPLGNNQFAKILDYSTDSDGVFIYWDRTRYHPWCDLNYPLSLDGNIFKRSVLCDLLQPLHFTQPNDLEVKLLGQAYKLPSTIVSCRHSICTNITLNAVQTMMKNPEGRYSYSLEKLNTMYLDGIELDLERMEFDNITKTHEDVKPLFRIVKGD